MSNWHNTGAKVLHGDSDIKTKTALKAAIKADPTNVVLYSTDAFGPNRGKRFVTDNLTLGDKYTVVGPNPYTSRKWYATVELLPNGTIKVS